jgi:alkyl hydroperoxide reductase subunit AhpC
VQLQEHLERFAEAGIGVVGLTYDPPEAHRQFVERRNIGYPMLSDVDAVTVSALGIRNDDYEPDHSAYGIPHPGIYVLDRDLVIREKLFVEGYERRVDAEAVLRVARRALDRDGAAGHGRGSSAPVSARESAPASAAASAAASASEAAPATAPSSAGS